MKQQASLQARLPQMLTKYQRVIKPLVLVLLFDLLLLSVNTLFAVRLESAATLINVAGRQRMLSQRIGKSAALLDYLQTEGLAQQRHWQNLSAASELFEQTLQGFINGGHIQGADGSRLWIEPIADPELRNIAVAANRQWQPLQEAIVQSRDNPDDDQALARLMGLVVDDQDALLTLMNRLTVGLERAAARDTWWLRLFQSAIVIIVVALFVLSLVRLYRAEKYYDTLMEASNDVVMSVSVKSGRITFISRSVERLSGRSVADFMRQSVEQLFTAASASEFYRLLRVVEAKGELPQKRMEAEVCLQEGEPVIMDCVMNLSKDERGVSSELVVDLRDITERKQVEMKLKQLAHRDALTGLPNRNVFFDIAGQSIKRAERDKDGMAILFVDLDGFKQINDQHGHDIGDQLLCQIAQQLSGCLRQSDTVCRLGGDEFVILVEQLKDPAGLSSLCEKLQATLSQPQEINTVQCQVGVSMGIAVYPQDGCDARVLINRADAAMYAVKRAGKGGYRFFSALPKPV